MSTSPTPRLSDPGVLKPAPVPVRFDEGDEDEWFHHLTLALHEAITFGGYSTTLVWVDVEVPYYEMTLTDPTPPMPSVRFFDTADGVIATIGPATDTERGVWESAMAEATRRMGTGQSDFKWSGHIADDMRSFIAKPVSVGPLCVSGSSSPYFEHKQPVLALPSGSMEWSYPARVKSSAKALEWRSAMSRAGEDLYRLCAILSVATASHWSAKRFGVAIHDSDDIDAPMPSHATSGPLLTAGIQDTDNLDRRPIELPAWVESAWEIAGDPTIAPPLSAYYRGLLHEDEDPTTALALFVASIEGIGARYVELERCGQCGVSKGARARYRHALRFVMTDEQAKPLVKQYDLRSAAAHGDAVAGQPLTFTPFGGGGMFYTSPDRVLQRGVGDLHRASQAILELALSGRLP